MIRIGVDMDQCIADLLAEWISLYNYDYKDNLKTSQITSWNFHHLVKPECGEKIYNYLDSQELFENLPVIEGSQKVLKDLSSDFEIIVVTAPWNAENVSPKSKWLKKHFPFIPEHNYVFTRNKGLIQADYLIDDKPDNFKGFVGQGLLYDAPHNQFENRYRRFCSWNEVLLFFNAIRRKELETQR